MAVQFRRVAGFLLLYWIGAASALITSETRAPPVPQAISDMRDLIVKGLGFQGAEDFKVSGFDVRDALVGQSVAYEFDIEVDKKVVPFKLLEDVSRWGFVDLPIFRPPAEDGGDEEKALAERGRSEERVVSPVLPPFQITGPMELWIQDADDMRLALPHDVDAGTLIRKVLLSDGAAVTVKGARSVSLRNPLELPLPLNRTSLHDGPHAASVLLNIAEALRNSARSSDQPLVSLRIIGPSSLTSSSSSSSSPYPNKKLKLKRLSPGLVVLSSPAVPASPEDIISLSGGRNLWPLTTLNGSNSNLRGFEELLVSVLGKRGFEKGKFRLLKADASAQTYMKMSFSVEKKLADGDADWSQFPSWKTKPEKAAAHFEVLARVEGGRKVVPERIQEVQPVRMEDSVMDSVQSGNISMTHLPLMFPPPNFFTV